MKPLRARVERALRDTVAMGESETGVYGIGLFALTASSATKDGRLEWEAITRPTGGIAEYPSTLAEVDDVAVVCRVIRAPGSP
jgi:hypothetical protein